MEISALAEYIVKALMDYPDRVVVKEIKGIATAIWELGVHEADIGKVIGRKGVTITALRTIPSTAGGKENVVLRLNSSIKS